MKTKDQIAICQKCFDKIVAKGKNAIVLYLEICSRHFDGHFTCLNYPEDSYYSDLAFLESGGYVVSADTEQSDVIKVMPHVRKYRGGHEYCCERTKHFP